MKIELLVLSNLVRVKENAEKMHLKKNEIKRLQIKRRAVELFVHEQSNAKKVLTTI